MEDLSLEIEGAAVKAVSTITIRCNHKFEWYIDYCTLSIIKNQTKAM